MLRKLCKIEPA
jgi:coatomer subunit beta